MADQLTGPSILAQIERLKAENAKLRGALEPFASAYDPDWMSEGDRTFDLLTGTEDVRRAWLALND